MNVKLELGKIKEGIRLLRSGIERPEEIFTPAQLYTYHVLSSESKSLTEDERELLMLASSDSAKTCSILF